MAFPLRKITKEDDDNTMRYIDDIFRAASNGLTNRVLEILDDGFDVNATDAPTGLTVLHIAVGTDNLDLTRKLVEDYNASFKTDQLGRFPSVVAMECQVSDDMCDYIVYREAEDLWGPQENWPPNVRNGPPQP